MGKLLDTRCVDYDWITLVMNNLNTHPKGAFNDAFPPEQARSYIQRNEFCYTPKHGSWLNIAEYNLNGVSSQF